jgi:mono/diheme cytochrome c family protein
MAALLVISGAGTAWAAGQTLGQPLPQRSPEKVYASTCGYCHGTNIGPIIRGRGLPAGTIQAMVRSGMNAMPAFRPSEISPAELAALAQWIEKSSADPKEKGQ